MYSVGAKRVKQEPLSQEELSPEQPLQEQPSDSPVTTEIQASRRREPEHFLLKVESFSKSKMDKYVSDEFEAGGHKWRLILYPNGDKERNGSDYISLYLSISDVQNLPLGWEIEADFSLFVYNHVSQKYQTYKLSGKTFFNWLKTDLGFPQLIPLNKFKETLNGYLFGDTCVFGAEIIVIKSSSIAKRQTLSMQMEHDSDFDTDTDTNTNIFTWTIGNFSTLNVVRIQSERFIIGDVQWFLSLYPKGQGDGKGKGISLFLGVANDKLVKLAESHTVKVEHNIRIMNHLNTNHFERKCTCVFSHTSLILGYANIMPISDVVDKSKGFLKDDGLVVEVEFIKVEIIKNFK